MIISNYIIKKWKMYITIFMPKIISTGWRQRLIIKNIFPFCNQIELSYNLNISYPITIFALKIFIKIRNKNSLPWFSRWRHIKQNPKLHKTLNVVNLISFGVLGRTLQKIGGQGLRVGLLWAEGRQCCSA